MAEKRPECPNHWDWHQQKHHTYYISNDEGTFTTKVMEDTCPVCKTLLATRSVPIAFVVYDFYGQELGQFSNRRSANDRCPTTGRVVEVEKA